MHYDLPRAPLIGTYVKEIKDALKARHSLDSSLHWLRQSGDRPNRADWIALHATQFEHTLVSAYLPALASLRAAYSVDALTAEREHQWARLQRGFVVEGDHATDLWLEVLAVYEVLEDALAQPGDSAPADLWRFCMQRAAGGPLASETGTSGVSVPVDAPDALTGDRKPTCASSAFVDESPAVARVG